MTIDDPTVTENAIMLTGYIAARLGFATGDGMYRVSSVVPDEATLTVEHVANGNTYAVQVRQIGGIR